MADDSLTDQQRKWMASVKASLEASTGRTLGEWAAIARSCPETAPRARQRWLKEQHGLGQNYAMMVLAEVNRESGTDPRDPAVLQAALWADPAAAAIFQALCAAIAALPDVVTGQRKAYTTWSRAYAFAAARPARGGGVRLGLAVAPDAASLLQPAAKEGWSERLKASVTLVAPGAVDQPLRHLLAAAWESS